MAQQPVVFDYSAWSTAFPQFSNVSQSGVTVMFGLAQSFVDNSGCSILSNVAPSLVLQNALWFTTAHLCQLFYGSTLQPLSPLVGRIASVTQGSVSFTADMGQQAQDAVWWNQTQYGAAAWLLMAPSRTFAYVPGPCLGAGIGGNVAVLPGFGLAVWPRGS